MSSDEVAADNTVFDLPGDTPRGQLRWTALEPIDLPGTSEAVSREKANVLVGLIQRQSAANTHVELGGYFPKLRFSFPAAAAMAL